MKEVGEGGCTGGVGGGGGAAGTAVILIPTMIEKLTDPEPRTHTRCVYEHLAKGLSQTLKAALYSKQ